jgi:very-short-patch-repair endonuclease
MSRRKTTIQFIEEAISIHGGKYDYSETKYVNARENVSMLCREHGVFNQTPTAHLGQKQGCPRCAANSRRTKKTKTLREFLVEAKSVHGERYGYDMIDYRNTSEKVAILCNKHGVFYQLPSHHLRGIGCPACGTERTATAKNKTSKDFISDAMKVHGVQYDYSAVDYVRSHVKVEIICPKHGVFTQTPASHLSGKGCPSCNESHGEKVVADILNELCVVYERQKTFPDCQDIRPLRFDFFVESLGVAIEYDGIQHCEMRSFGGNKMKADREFQRTKRRDGIKDAYCRMRGIVLLRLPNFICKDTIEERIRQVLYLKSKISAQVLGDDTNDSVLRRLGPKDLARLL